MRFSKEKKRSFRCPHPDGGVFFIKPAKAAGHKHALQRLFKDELLTDNAGNVLYNKSGEPARRVRADIDAVIQTAIDHVDRFEGIYDADQCAHEDDAPHGEECRFLEASAENIAILVRNYIGTEELTSAPAEGEQPTTQLVPKPLYEWVTEQCAKVTDQLREFQRKN